MAGQGIIASSVATGSFARSFSLPETVEAENAKAD